MTYSNLISLLKQGNARAAARLITIVENNFEAAEQIIRDIYKDTGNAYILGVTGAPGSGKSTFISTITKIFVDQGKRVGVICIDPSSPLTGGALLGDRIRMKQNFILDKVFIRSMANRGRLGGLAKATEDAIKILDVYGCDVIIVETVGVGQSEIDIFKSAQTVVVLLVPGLGDDIQAIKAGIMEITDIFVINKMDIPGADKKVAEILQMLELNKNFILESNEVNDESIKKKRWTPQVIKINSLTGENFEDLLKIIQIHEEFLKSTGLLLNYEKVRIKTETLQILKEKLTKKVEELINDHEKIKPILEKVLARALDPYTMADLIIEMLGKQ